MAYLISEHVPLLNLFSYKPLLWERRSSRLFRRLYTSPFPRPISRHQGWMHPTSGGPTTNHWETNGSTLLGMFLPGSTGKGFVNFHSFTWMAETDWVSPYGVIGGIKSSFSSFWKPMDDQTFRNIIRWVSQRKSIVKHNFLGKIVINWNHRAPQRVVNMKTSNVEPIKLIYLMLHGNNCLKFI